MIERLKISLGKQEKESISFVVANIKIDTWYLQKF